MLRREFIKPLISDSLKYWAKHKILTADSAEVRFYFAETTPESKKELTNAANAVLAKVSYSFSAPEQGIAHLIPQARNITQDRTQDLFVAELGSSSPSNFTALARYVFMAPFLAKEAAVAYPMHLGKPIQVGISGEVDEEEGILPFITSTQWPDRIWEQMPVSNVQNYMPAIIVICKFNDGLHPGQPAAFLNNFLTDPRIRELISVHSIEPKPLMNCVRVNFVACENSMGAIKTLVETVNILLGFSTAAKMPPEYAMPVYRDFVDQRKLWLENRAMRVVDRRAIQRSLECAALEAAKHFFRVGGASNSCIPPAFALYGFGTGPATKGTGSHFIPEETLAVWYNGQAWNKGYNRALANIPQGKFPEIAIICNIPRNNPSGLSEKELVDNTNDVILQIAGKNFGWQDFSSIQKYYVENPEVIVSAIKIYPSNIVASNETMKTVIDMLSAAHEIMHTNFNIVA